LDRLEVADEGKAPAPGAASRNLFAPDLSQFLDHTDAPELTKSAFLRHIQRCLLGARLPVLGGEDLGNQERHGGQSSILSRLLRG
jgi:hypothetical protein